MEEIKKEKDIKFKVVCYLLIGLLFNILGLIGGLLWMKFKVKTNRKKKLFSLLLGFALYLLYAFILMPFVFQPLIQKNTYQAFFKEYPDAEIVTKTIQGKYPDDNVFTGVNKNLVNSNGITSSTTIFSVQHISQKRLLTSKELQEIARETCSITESQGKKYDKIKILSLKYILPLKIAEVHWSIEETCENWKTKDFSDEEPPF